MSNSSPLKTQNFLFIREKLETKLKQFKKTVLLDAGRYNRNVTTTTLQNALRSNIVVSHSGRTLGDILSLSYSQELSVYTVDKVVPGFGREGTVVHYSRPENEIAELRRETQEERNKLQAQLDNQQVEIDELKKTIGGNSEVLAEWQTTSLVMCAFSSFAWKFVSTIDQAELKQYNIHCFWDLYHAQSTGPARNISRRIYRKIDENVRSCVDSLVGMKLNVAESQRKLAHPFIPQDALLEFLSKLGSGEPGLEPIEIEMFDYLKSRSNHPENIECARKGG